VCTLPFLHQKAGESRGLGSIFLSWECMMYGFILLASFFYAQSQGLWLLGPYLRCWVSASWAVESPSLPSFSSVPFQEVTPFLCRRSRAQLNLAWPKAPCNCVLGSS
jgi:hypothetical protein